MRMDVEEAAARELEGFGPGVVERLRRAVEEETAAIAAFGRVDYEAFHARKSQGLLEVIRLLSACNERPPSRLCEALRALERALAENQRLLRVQLAAATAITDLISQAIRESHSDGTYCADGRPESRA